MTIRRVLGMLATVAALIVWPAATAAAAPSVNCLINPAACAIEGGGDLIGGGLGNIDPLNGDFNPVDCASDVTVGRPDSGAASSIDPGPANPRTGDPFADTPEASIYEAYGYAGLSWPSLNTECSLWDLGGGQSIGGSAAGGIADMLLTGTSVGVGIITTVLRYAFDPGTMTLLDPLNQAGADVLGGGVFYPLFGITLILVGLYVAVRARHGDIKDALTHTGWALMVGLIATAAVAYPTTIGPTVDRAVTGLLSHVNEAVAWAAGDTESTPADTTASNLHHAVLYQTWCSGMVGRADGPTAEEFCPRLFAAANFTRTEWDAVKGDPGAASELADQKRETFLEVADELKDADPAAFEYLNGSHNTERVWFAVMGVIGLLCSGLFVLVGGLLLLYGLVVLRIALMVFPLVAVVGAFPTARHHATKVLDYTFGALVSAVTFGAVAAVFVILIGGLLDPSTGMHPLLTMILMLCATAAAWVLTKPHRQVKGLRKKKPDMHMPERVDAGERWWAAREGHVYSTDVEVAAGAAAEGRRRSVVYAATVGAAQGAAATVVTGGAAIPAGAAAAATAAVDARRTEALPGPTVAPQRTPAPRELPAGVPDDSDAPPRVYEPGADMPPARVAAPAADDDGETFYTIYTPDEDEATL